MAADDPGSFLDRLIAAETGCAEVCPSAVTAGAIRARLVGIADQVKPFVGKDPAERVNAMNRFVLEHLGIRPSKNLKDADNLVLVRVLDRKRGYCVGIVSLYLVVAERLGLPIFAVATPSHVFLRYDDGSTRINIETFQGGASIPDAQYIREEKIPQESIDRGVFMRNLTPEEFLAQIHNNLGVIYSERKDYDWAAQEYRRATRLAPDFPAPRYNFANDLLKQGAFRRAIRFFSKSLDLYGTDVWALNNRGVAHMKMGRPEKARRDFEEALRLDPGFEEARGNLESLLSDDAT